MKATFDNVPDGVQHTLLYQLAGRTRIRPFKLRSPTNIRGSLRLGKDGFLFDPRDQQLTATRSWRQASEKIPRLARFRSSPLTMEW